MKKLLLLLSVLIPITATALTNTCTDPNGRSAAWTCAVEDTAHVSGHTGMMLMGVRNDSLNVAFTGTNGDYTPVSVSQNGALAVMVNNNGGNDSAASVFRSEDSASAHLELIGKVGAVRDDVLQIGADTSLDGDWTIFRVDNLGALWTDSIPRGDLVADADKHAVVKYAKIDIAGADSDTVISAVASKKFKVLGYVIGCAGATTITFEDGDLTDLTGNISLAANAILAVAPHELGQFETPTANKNLQILKSAAVDCDGHITYIEVD